MGNHADNLIVGDDYIAGLIDSDFGIYINRFFPRGKLQLRPEIYFVNTRFSLIEVVSTYLSTYGIKHYVGNRTATVGKNKKIVVIQRPSMCIAFYNRVVEHCVVRYEQLNILKEFCSDRLYYVEHMGYKQNNTPYTDKQIALYDKMVDINLNYNMDYGYRNDSIEWLSGFLDGDGSICFVVTKDKPSKKILVNGDMAIYYGDRITPSIDFYYWI
jgi:hypothetical protein